MHFKIKCKQIYTRLSNKFLTHIFDINDTLFLDLEISILNDI